MVVCRKTMWKVHLVDLGKLFRFWRVVIFLIPNLTRCRKVDLKTDPTKKFWFKIWQDEKIFIQNHAFYKSFFFEIMLFTKTFVIKIMLLKNYFSSKSCFLNMNVKRKLCAFYGVKWDKTWLFVCKIFSKFKNVLFKNNFFFQIVLLKNLFFFKSWRVVKFLYQNLTRCIIFISKSNTLYKFLFKTCFSNRIFRLSLNYYQTATNYQLVGKWRQLGVKDFSTSVWYALVSLLLLSFSSLRSLWRLGSWWMWWLYHLHCQLIYTNLFGFQKMVSLQRFNFERN